MCDQRNSRRESCSHRRSERGGWPGSHASFPNRDTRVRTKRAWLIPPRTLPTCPRRCLAQTSTPSHRSSGGAAPSAATLPPLPPRLGRPPSLGNEPCAAPGGSGEWSTHLVPPVETLPTSDPRSQGQQTRAELQGRASPAPTPTRAGLCPQAGSGTVHPVRGGAGCTRPRPQVIHRSLVDAAAPPEPPAGHQSTRRHGAGRAACPVLLRQTSRRERRTADAGQGDAAKKKSVTHPSTTQRAR